MDDKAACVVSVIGEMFEEERQMDMAMEQGHGRDTSLLDLRFCERYYLSTSP